MLPNVSVIIPLYNAEKYIQSCVDSVLNQNLKNIEVIIVDDCSTDNSLELCRKLYADDSRVVILKQQQNGGPGLARNSGIKAAKGKYIAFVDSDDQVLPEHLSEMYEAAEKYDADFVHASGFLICRGDNSSPDMLSLAKDSFMKVSLDREPVKEVCVMTESDREIMLQKWSENYYNCSLFIKLFRREMLINDNIEFIDTPMAEDLTFCFESMFHSKRFVMIPSHSYIYRILQESLSRSKSPAEVLLKTLKSSITVMQKIQLAMKRIKFFTEDNSRYQKVLNALNERFDKFHVIPCFKQINEQDLRNDSRFKALFEKFFDLDAPYVTHLFFTAYNSQPDIPDVWGDMSTSSDFWENMRDD